MARAEPIELGSKLGPRGRRDADGVLGVDARDEDDGLDDRADDGADDGLDDGADDGADDGLDDGADGLVGATDLAAGIDVYGEIGGGLAVADLEPEPVLEEEQPAPTTAWLAPPPRPTAIEMLGRAVLRLRLYRGWKQIDVERRTGIDQTTISRLERGERRGLSIRRLARILDALVVGDIAFEPFEPGGPPTALELMLGGNRWERAGRAADRRLRRPSRSRTTISTRPLSETP